MPLATANTGEAAYVLGHADRELERLRLQAQLFEPLTRQFFCAAGIEAGMRVLDVGCGCGDVSFLVARLVGPTGEVVGIDRALVAVTTARRRALDLQLPNTRFVAADAGDLALDEPFDAVVGRCVLAFCPDPAATLRHLVRQVRPRGVVAFQEPDFAACHTLPVLPTVSRCVRWVAAALERTGADPYCGLKLAATFTTIGLPAPALSLHAGIAAGADQPLYALIAETVRSVLPVLERLGLVAEGEVKVDTLARRLSEEAVATQATVAWVGLVGAAARKPAL